MVRNQWDMVALLISRGVDLHYQEPTSAGITAAQYAWTIVLGSRSHFRLPEAVLQSLNETDIFDLMQFNGVHGIVTGLLDQDLEHQLDMAPALVEDLDFNGRTPLFWSVRRGDSHLTAILIARGADVNHQDFYGSTPLHFAALADDPQCTKLLIMARADINVLGGISGIRMTPLTAATLAGSTAFAVALLDAGADPHSGELPPLFAAASMGNMEMEHYLCRYGASIDRRFAKGHATVMEATTTMTPNHVDSLQNTGMQLDSGGSTMTNHAVGSGNILASKMMCYARPGEMPLTRQDGDKYWSAFLHLRGSYRVE